MELLVKIAVYVVCAMLLAAACYEIYDMYRFQQKTEEIEKEIEEAQKKMIARMERRNVWIRIGEDKYKCGDCGQVLYTEYISKRHYCYHCGSENRLED